MLEQDRMELGVMGWEGIGYDRTGVKCDEEIMKAMKKRVEEDRNNEVGLGVKEQVGQKRLAGLV